MKQIILALASALILTASAHAQTYTNITWTNSFGWGSYSNWDGGTWTNSSSWTNDWATHGSYTNQWWTNYAGYSTNLPTQYTNHQQRTWQRGGHDTRGSYTARTQPTAPADVQTLVSQFQANREALITQLRGASDTERQAALAQLQQLRDQLKDQLSSIREQAHESADNMRHRFNDDRNRVLNGGVGGVTPGRDR